MENREENMYVSGRFILVVADFQLTCHNVCGDQKNTCDYWLPRALAVALLLGCSAVPSQSNSQISNQTEVPRDGFCF